MHKRKIIKNNMKKNRKVALLAVSIMMICFSLTFGYAAFSDQFTITDIVAHVRVFRLVRINGVTTKSGAVTDLDYNTNSILNTVYIPAGESVTYSVTATNLGNVPVAVSEVSFSNGNGTVSNLSSDISSNNYIKICNDNDECENGASKTFDVTVTNNGSTPISGELDVNLTFTELYKIYYEGSEIGDEALAGTDFTHEFTSNPPSKLSKIDGDCDSFNYDLQTHTLTITNVQSDVYFTESHTIFYNGSVLGYANDGGPFNKTFDKEWPATITKDSGTCDSVNYDFQSHTLSLTNILSDISLTGKIGEVAITRITYVSDKNVASHSNPSFNGMNVNFDVTFRKEEGSTVDGFEIVYEVELTNTHYNDYIFRGFDFHPTITASANSDTAYLTLTPSGVTNGEVIASGATKTFTVTLTLVTNNDTGSYDTSSNAGVDTTPDTEEETGEITASIAPNTGDLRSPNTRAEFTVTVNNTYPSDREFTLISSNSNLEIVDSNGIAFSDTVHGSSNEPFTVYVKAVQGAQFVNNTDTMTMYLSSSFQKNVTVGNLTFNVDKYNIPDTTKVTVGNVQIALHRDSENAAPTTGQIDVTWDRKDYGGSAISDYTVLLYNTSDSNTAAATGHTNSGTRSYSFTDVADGTYYVVVYGIDSATPTPNSGASDVASATTADGFASRTADSPFEWRFDVTVNAENLAITGNGNDVALLEQSHTVTVTASGSDSNDNNYIVANQVEVTMGGNTLRSGTDYTFTRSSNNRVGTIKINKVTGNITVTAARATGGGGTCLIKGTKVLLANGKYKNIENINYNDLIMAYNYETGKFVSEYPIWIEKPKDTDNYQQITFSDGTILKTYGYHGIYETELKRFVSVDNPEEFHVGSKVAKMKKNGNDFETVTVTNIETKHEKTKYYQVVSTRYFNIITNDLLTVDGTTALSNLYGFNDDVTWIKEIRDKDLLDVYSYDELKDTLPYYMFKGMRAEEGKALIKYGIDLTAYKNFLSIVVNKEKMWLQPMQKNGKNVWMVTTSLDKINEINKNEFLREEGSIYTLPKVNKKNFAGWLNYADNKMYKPGDNIEVYYGMHFEAIYK